MTFIFVKVTDPLPPKLSILGVDLFEFHQTQPTKLLKVPQVYRTMYEFRNLKITHEGGWYTECILSASHIELKNWF